MTFLPICRYADIGDCRYADIADIFVPEDFIYNWLGLHCNIHVSAYNHHSLYSMYLLKDEPWNQMLSAHFSTELLKSKLGDVTSMFSRLSEPAEQIFEWTLLNWLQWWANPSPVLPSFPKSGGFGFEFDLNSFEMVDLDLSFFKAVDLYLDLNIAGFGFADFKWSDLDLDWIWAFLKSGFGFVDRAEFGFEHRWICSPLVYTCWVFQGYKQVPR